MADEKQPEDLTPIADDRVISILRGLTADVDESTSMAHELKWRRARMREDSRRAQQLKRLRWTVENLVEKVEKLSRGEEIQDG